MKNIHRINGLIYITSEEYIGLSYYIDGNLVREGVVDDKQYWEARKDYKKIILTNDPALTSEGVQAINPTDEKWLNENKSCEWVEVRKEKYSERFYYQESAIGNTENWGNRYIVYLPKQSVKDRILSQTSEETKQKVKDYANNLVNNSLTIEEAAETYVNNFSFGISHSKRVCKKAFANGAKSQAAREYWFKIFKSEQQC